MYAHARRYLHGCYPSDQDIGADAAVVAWVADLERRLPGGLGGVVGEELTVEGVARLAAILMHVGTVEHEVMGTGLWNYQVWTHVQPVRVHRDGRRDPLDTYQRLVNYNFMLNVRRAPLRQDLSYLAVDRAGGVRLPGLPGRPRRAPGSGGQGGPRLLADLPRHPRSQRERVAAGRRVSPSPGRRRRAVRRRPGPGRGRW